MLLLLLLEYLTQLGPPAASAYGEHVAAKAHNVERVYTEQEEVGSGVVVVTMAGITAGLAGWG